MEIYFLLEPATPSADIAGVYSVTLTASNSCKLPDRALTRRYTATIASSGRPTSFLATLSDARFFSTLPCPSGRPPDSCMHNRFGIGIAGDYGDIGVGIVEQLNETSYLVVEAGGEGTFSANGITVPLSGALRYCPSEPHWTSGEYWDCEGGIQCDAQDHQLALIRR
jgi:hypothetical protein